MSDTWSSQSAPGGSPPSGAPNPQYPPPSPPYGAPPRPDLRRSRDNRVVAGVCGGVGRTLGIDPVIPRVVLAVLTLFGGTGLLLYAIGWLFIPEDGAPESPAEGFIRRNGRGVTIAIAIVIGCVLLPIVGLAVFAGSWGLFGGFDLGALIIIGLVVGVIWWVVKSRDERERAAAATAPYAPVAYGGEQQQTAPFSTDPGVAPTQPVPTQQQDWPAGWPRQDWPTQPVAQQGWATQPSQEWPTQPVSPYAGGQPESPTQVLPVGPPPPPYGWTPPPPPIPKPPKEKSVLGLLTVSAAALVVGALLALDRTDLWDVPGVVYAASALAVIGLGLAIGGFVGRARWLVIIAIPLTMATAVSTQVVKWDGARTGDITWTPQTIAEAEEEFRIGAGSARIDLTEIEGLDSLDDDIDVDVEGGAAEIRVILPSEVPATVRAEAGIGDVRVNDRESSGFGATVSRTLGDTTEPGIDLDINLSVGEVRVIREAS